MKKKEKEKENENEITTNEIPISRCVEPLLSLSLSLSLSALGRRGSSSFFLFFFSPRFRRPRPSFQTVGGMSEETGGKREEKGNGANYRRYGN